METKTLDKLYTLVTAQNTKDKYEQDNGEYCCEDVFVPLTDYNIEDVLSQECIEALSKFNQNKYFDQTEAHEVIAFLLQKCYNVGYIKQYRNE